MTFRVTPHRQIEQQLLHAQSHTSRSATFQNQISSGLRVQRPSDDPQAQRTILNQQAAIDRLETQIGSIDHSRTYLNQSNSELLDANGLLVQAKSLAQQARQSVDEFEVKSLGEEIDGFLKTLDTIANAKVDGRYLYGGTEHDQPPYSGISAGPTNYQGSVNPGNVILSNEDTLSVFQSGEDVFSFVNSETNEKTDVFATLRNLRDEMKDFDIDSREAFGESVDKLMSELEQGSDHVLSVVGEQSVSLQQLDRIQERTEDLQFQATQLLSDTQSTDISEAVIGLQQEQNMLQLTLASTARLFEISVLDYL